MRTERLGEYGKYMGAVGYRNVKIRNVEQFLEKVRAKLGDTHVQFFNAELVAGWEHVLFAVLNALTAFKNKRNISNSLAVEILLFASAQRQIKRAVQLMGINENTSEIVAVIIADEQKKTSGAVEKISEFLHGEEDNSVLEINDEKFCRIREAFGISDEELKAKLRRKGLEKEALTELVVEHMALLATQR